MSFGSVVGQEALTTTLKNAVQSGKLAHAFLFCGPRGVGKTTCARIFAKTINCEHPTADGEACGECESCKSFAEQRSYNIFELDAASNNSVENIKQLMEQTRIPPQVGKYKVFIIDEVHMLSTQAFNAFLKTLEEPPTYVIFILATTEKNKLLPTILSRCQIYDFDRMTVENTVAHLKMVAEREGYTYEPEALEVIAEKADGGMRDALSIFDQAASFCQGNITLEKVVKDLNLLDIENYFQLIDLALENKCAEIMVLLNNMLANGIDGNNIVNGLGAHVRNVMMAKDPQTLPLLEVSKRYTARYEEQAKKAPATFLYKALQHLTRCDLNYRQSSNKRLLVELTLIEVGQITQPEDASAPRGGHRLKSLFKKLKVMQQKAAEQVAAAASPAIVVTPTSKAGADPVAPTQSQQTTTPITSPTPSTSNGSAGESAGQMLGDSSSAGQIPKSSVTPSSLPRINASSLGSTFSSLRKKNDNSMNNDDTAEIENKDEDKPFDTNELLSEWLSMCTRMAQNKQFIGLATSMRNLQPQITEYPNIEVVVTNTILLEQIKYILNRIKITLAQRLHNGQINVTLRVAEQSEMKPILTKHEIFENMCKDASVLDLVKGLDLELV